ncbi:MAG: ribosome recycling factor [Microgenomates group bacterium Gr01-1014_93]|nr:MAG: ribosome recycling factor [Microgenomates group bacterium Gr01-1014_93]
MDPNLSDPNKKIDDALDYLKQDLSGIRAGRANPALVENIQVESYGTKMKLVELGTISAPQPSLLTIQVWDLGLVGNVVKAIQESNLGLNPATDGQVVRLPIPPLTEERRQEFVKLTHQKLEDKKVEIRQIRQDIRQDWVHQKESGKISEDELFRREKLLQDLVDKKMEELEEMGKIKEQELLEI